MNLSKIINERIYLILMISIVLGSIIFAAVIWPMMNRVKELQHQESLMTHNAQLLSGLMKKNYKDGLGPQLIAKNEASRVIEEITALGAEHSVTFLSLLQQDKKKTDYKKINTLPVELETRSTFKQLGFFMEQLNNLKLGIVLIDKYQIIRDENEPDKVKSKIHMYICLKKEERGEK